MFTLCVVSGSEGTFNIFKILSTFLNPKYKIQVLILCGNNSEMVRAVKTLKSLSEKIRGPKITGVGYTDSMQFYLRAADLVVGKAGPNTMFQSAATLTPFFAISHISGQEDGNLDIIKRYGIGYVEENPRLATQKLKQIIDNPKILNKFTKNLKALSKYCQGSGEKLLTLLRK
jgi:UDP-N-acetylglucosamine:LPS N-acetylglucosamine transferase